MRTRNLALVVVLGLVASSPAWPANMDCPAKTRGFDEHAAQIGGRVFAFTRGSVVELKSAAAYCLSCHDGAVAPAVSVAMAQPVHGSAAAGVASHQVDVPYPANRAGFRNVAQLDPRLALDNGRVTCKTCHSGDDPSGSALSITMDGSELCLSCHLK